MEENKQEKVVNQVFTKEDMEKNKGMAIAAYIIWLIPFFGAKDSKFAQYHAKQGLVLFLAALGASIVVQIFFSIFFGSMSFYSLLRWAWFFNLVWGALWIATIVLAVIGIINANNGEAKELPVIGKYAKKFFK